MTPNCEKCINRNDCSLLEELSEARETIFNYGREMSGRTDFIYKGRVVPAEGVEADATREELFAAVRLIKEHCARRMTAEACYDCLLQSVCNRCFVGIPDKWPDPEEGGGEDG